MWRRDRTDNFLLFRFHVEMHMVHTSHDHKESAVIAFLYKLGSPDPFLAEVMNWPVVNPQCNHRMKILIKIFMSQVEKYIRNISGAEGQKIDAGMINPNDTIEQYHGYYRYLGSLTTPPCTEGVVWTVMQQVRSVSMEQVQMLINATPVSTDFKNETIFILLITAEFNS